MNKYYVYFHKNPTNGEVFYVGKGCGSRAYVNANRGKHYFNYVRKYGNPIVEIVKDNLTSLESIELEKKLISEIGRRDLKKGTLINSTNGGEYGVVGLIHTDDSKLKMSHSKKGKQSNAKGKKWSDTSREKMRTTMLGSKRGNYKERKDKGKTFSEEIRKKLSDGWIGKKPILQFDKDGNFIKEWGTTVMAENDLKINGIRNVLDNPLRKCGGFIWKRKKHICQN
jgi:hypothetical protein